MALLYAAGIPAMVDALPKKYAPLMLPLALIAPVVVKFSAFTFPVAETDPLTSMPCEVKVATLAVPATVTNTLPPDAGMVTFVVPKLILGVVILAT